MDKGGIVKTVYKYMPVDTIYKHGAVNNTRTDEATGQVVGVDE